jgi:hypothetical protein
LKTYIKAIQDWIIRQTEIQRSKDRERARVQMYNDLCADEKIASDEFYKTRTLVDWQKPTMTDAEIASVIAFAKKTVGLEAAYLKIGGENAVSRAKELRDYRIKLFHELDLVENYASPASVNRREDKERQRKALEEAENAKIETISAAGIEKWLK